MIGIDADALSASYAQGRRDERKEAEAREAALLVALDEARNALKIALPAVDEHGLNMDRHIVRKAIIGCDSAIDTALAVNERSTP